MSNASVQLVWNVNTIKDIEHRAIKGMLRMGFDMSNMAKSNAPYKSGALSNSIRVEEDAENVLVIAGGKYGGKDVPYAAAVEYGHKQKVGKFVPGRWSGDRFIYDRTAKTGMVLKTPYIKGSHYMQRAKDYILTGNYVQKYFGDIL